ncbi:hypothetical protein ABH11_00608 [Serratia marcescens]|uniref:hypothetical protein n=1 Tax=Serratia marcescens TaxID=615 RepID=UPI0006CB782C|nr:hypothetical protein [Serratia marcescens]ALE94970.1 hypothetical protein ABH11_00608 [Serratia marcescens]
MTTIKRFTPDYKMHAVRFEAFAREAEHGELVQFNDHQQAVSDLEAERDAARNAIAAIYKAVTGECPEWSNWHAYLDDIVEEVGAAVANIQAQGVEKAIERLMNMFASTGHIGLPVMALEGLAKELREAK